MMRTTVLYCVVIAAGLLLFSSISPSYADYKVYPGSECVRWDERVDPVTFINASRRYNPSTTTSLRIDCPAVKDRDQDIRTSWIRVYDAHPSDSTCARLIAYKFLGSTIVGRASAAVCTPTGWNSTQAYQLNTGGVSGIPYDAHYYFSVYHIPPRTSSGYSGVATYYVDEYDWD